MGIKSFDSASKGKTFTHAKVLGAAAVREMLKDAPDIETRFVKQEMKRFGKRVRAKVVRNRVKGRPGIKWRGPTGGGKGADSIQGVGGKKRLGKNIKSWASGKDTGNIIANVKISRLLRIHEDGLTINAKAGKWLTIIDRKKPLIDGKPQIIALVKKVRIPPRLKFRETFKSLEPDARVKIEKAMDRAATILEKRAAQKFKKSSGTGFGIGAAGF